VAQEQRKQRASFKKVAIDSESSQQALKSELERVQHELLTLKAAMADSEGGAKGDDSPTTSNLTDNAESNTVDDSAEEEELSSESEVALLQKKAAAAQVALQSENKTLKDDLGLAKLRFARLQQSSLDEKSEKESQIDDLTQRLHQRSEQLEALKLEYDAVLRKGRANSSFKHDIPVVEKWPLASEPAVHNSPPTANTSIASSNTSFSTTPAAAATSTAITLAEERACRQEDIARWIQGVVLFSVSTIRYSNLL
jgi:hypothetical protein